MASGALRTNGTTQRVDFATTLALAAALTTAEGVSVAYWVEPALNGTAAPAAREVVLRIPTSAGEFYFGYNNPNCAAATLNSQSCRANQYGCVLCSRRSAGAGAAQCYRISTSNALGYGFRKRNRGWHHVCHTISGTSTATSAFTNYVDGNSVNQGSDTALGGGATWDSVSNPTLSIGAQNATNWAKAGIRWVAIWFGRVLSAADAAELATGVSPLALSTGTSGLVFFAPLDENLVDSVGSVTGSAVASAAVQPCQGLDVFRPALWNGLCTAYLPKANRNYDSVAGGSLLTTEGNNSLARLENTAGTRTDLTQGIGGEAPGFLPEGTDGFPAAASMGPHLNGLAATTLASRWLETTASDHDYPTDAATILYAGSVELPLGTGNGGTNLFDQHLLSVRDSNGNDTHKVVIRGELGPPDEGGTVGVLDGPTPTRNFSATHIIPTASRGIVGVRLSAANAATVNINDHAAISITRTVPTLTAWAAATVYNPGDLRANGGANYRCVLTTNAIADAVSQPGVGTSWWTYWEIFDYGTTIRVARSHHATNYAGFLGNLECLALWNRSLSNGDYANAKADIKRYLAITFGSKALCVEGSSSSAFYMAANRRTMIRDPQIQSAFEVVDIGRGGDFIDATTSADAGIDAAGGLNNNCQRVSLQRFVAQYDALAKQTWEMIWVGQNDLGNSVFTGTTLLTKMSLRVGESRTDGVDKVLVTEILTAAGFALPQASYDTERAIFNAGIGSMANRPDGIVHFSATTMGQNGLAMPGTYFYDTLHTNSLGQRTILKPELLKALGLGSGGRSGRSARADRTCRT